MAWHRPGTGVRMTVTRALRSELVRLVRSPLVPLHLALALGVGGGAGAYLASTPWDPGLACDAFLQLLGAGAPLLAGISCGLAADAEREAGEYANLLGVAARRLALLGKGLVLLALGTLAAVLATASFCGLMAGAGKDLPGVPVLAQAACGLVAGSVASYVVGLAVALRLGRNAAIGLGALGLMVAVASMGGLANGLVTGTLSGSLGVGFATWVPFAWPSRLASLRVELALSGASSGTSAQVEGLLAAYGLVSASCLACTTALLGAGLALANRFEDVRRTGE